MTYPTLDEIRKILAPEEIWQLNPEFELILKRLISSLPACSNLSKYDYRYPKDEASLRGFLDKFFARHFFQVQNAILQEDTYERLIKVIKSGNITIADVGCGPAVASLAVLNLISIICSKINKRVQINLVLNDIVPEVLSIGNKMLDIYKKHLHGIGISRLLTIQKPFPDSMFHLRRISNLLAPYDICFLSYVILPLRESLTYEMIQKHLISLGKCCKPSATILITQDKFRENITRRLGVFLKASVNKLRLKQKTYDSGNSFDQYCYDYYRIAFFPDITNHGVERRFCLQ